MVSRFAGPVIRVLNLLREEAFPALRGYLVRPAVQPGPNNSYFILFREFKEETI